MGILNQNDTLVLIIDIQEKLINSVFNKETCASKSGIIAKTANILNLPVVVTEQYPKGLGNTIDSIKNALENAEYYEKISFSAIDDSAIFDAIKKHNKKQIVLFGIETHICVCQTAISLINQGYEVYVIKDACGSRVELEFLAGLERMKDNCVQILTTEIALFEWLKSAKHPKFKEIQTLIK